MKDLLLCPRNTDVPHAHGIGGGCITPPQWKTKEDTKNLEWSSARALKDVPAEAEAAAPPAEWVGLDIDVPQLATEREECEWTTRKEQNDLIPKQKDSYEDETSIGSYSFEALDDECTIEIETIATPSFDINLEEYLQDSSSLCSFPLDIDKVNSKKEYHENAILVEPLNTPENIGILDAYYLQQNCPCCGTDYRRVQETARNVTLETMTLHDVCCHYPRDLDAVQTVLNRDTCQVMVARHCPTCGYSFPLHIAISQNASLEVLRLLADVGPQVLLKEDGPNCYTPLSLAVASRPQDAHVHTYLLAANGMAAKLPSSQTNDLPLHVACQNGAPVSTLLMMVMEHGEAVYQRNVCGESPYDLMAKDVDGSSAPYSAATQAEILGIFSFFGKMLK